MFKLYHKFIQFFFTKKEEKFPSTYFPLSSPYRNPDVKTVFDEKTSKQVYCLVDKHIKCGTLLKIFEPIGTLPYIGKVGFMEYETFIPMYRIFDNKYDAYKARDALLKV